MKAMHWLTKPWGAAALIAALSGAGCNGASSGETAHLEGAITLDGQPLPADAQASITFQPTQHGHGRAVTVQVVESRYDSPNTPTGSVKAHLSIMKPTGKMLHSERTAEDYPETTSILPEKYASGIDLDVTGDRSDQDFEMVSK